MHGVARRHVDGCRAHLEAGVAQHVGRRGGVLRAHVRQQHMLSDADAPRDGLTDLAGADEDDDVLHDASLDVPLPT